MSLLWSRVIKLNKEHIFNACAITFLTILIFLTVLLFVEYKSIHGQLQKVEELKKEYNSYLVSIKRTFSHLSKDSDFPDGKHVFS